MKEVKLRIPKRVIERKNLARFGDARLGEENVTLLSKDFVSMEHPDDQQLEEVDDPTLKNTLASFIQKQQERSLLREFDDGMTIDDGANLDKSAPENEVKTADRYIPPGEKNQGENTLRVSNLTKNVTDDDLRELFEPFGKVLRISMPRVERVENGRTIKESKGFAYIAFAERESAEAALERLQGHGYAHLILRLEWAKPTFGIPAKEGGLSSSFVSGYGKQLAQDTKEKVAYASNLTGNT
jgi:translation initiation factor 3 subunit G